MARYSANWRSITAVAVADTTNMTDSGYMAFLQGGNNTMQLKINEIYLGGEDTASTPTSAVLARDSTVGATGISGVRNALLDGSATAPGTLAVTGNVSTTKPQRSATLSLLPLSLNTFGGLARWQARYGEEISTVGNTASLGEVSVSSVTGTGKTSGHILYELV
jgi:hypothetical protein